MRAGGLALGGFLTAAAVALACVEIPSEPDELLSFRVDPLPSPSVIVGDTLRDSTGRVAAVTVSAFNYRGERITNPPVTFRALDRRIRVDSLTGLVFGDTASTVASRVLVMVEGLTAFVSIPVSFRPDTVVGINDRDSVAYSLTDTTVNLSAAMGVRVLHRAPAGDSAVRNYRVDFALSPGDTAVARLVDDSERSSSVDTTDATGSATRRFRVNPARLAAPVDSVIAEARVLYRGLHVNGSPVRLVLKLKPR